jgi:hypothetical protein
MIYFTYRKHDKARGVGGGLPPYILLFLLYYNFLLI